MSATGRRKKDGTKTERREADYYPTPSWAVHSLLAERRFPVGDWLEPAVGDGAIIRAVDEVLPGIRWDACDIRPDCGYPGADIVDFLSLEPPQLPIYAAVLTNPPFVLAMPFVQQCLRFARQATLLLRVGFMETLERSNWLRRNAFDLDVLPKRPSFTGRGTDGTTYGWFTFPGTGRISVLQHPGKRRM